MRPTTVTLPTALALTLAGAVGTLALGALTVAPGGPAAAAGTCSGLPVTIVAPPGADVVNGTAGGDVIVADGARRVDAGAGDDTICATGVRWIAAGDGDDRVWHQEAPQGHVVVLGAGSDHFEGSDVRDRVWAEDFDGEDPAPGAGTANTDVVRTYGGKDRVLSGAPDQPNEDVVELGDGPDSVELGEGVGATAVVLGGRGPDELTVLVRGDARLDIDLVAGTVAVDGSRVAGVAGFEKVLAGAFRGRVVVRGTSGRDLIAVTAPNARVRADAGDDRVRIFGCGSVAAGGPGDDLLVSTYQGCRRDPVTLRGGPGDDRLRGSRAPDVLLGDAGRDRAAGAEGRDRCRAEVERSCESG